MMKTKQDKKPIELYFETHDPKYIADDAVFIDMETSELTVGREAITNMLHYIYNIAFDAKAEITNTFICNNKAVLEANFIGIHIGKFAGIPATRKSVNVPLCVAYDLENELIKVARIYLINNVLLQQLNS
ncbi:ester cyclase [Seonamhaeicola maritimus]|uniref:ester cyclase n=1 Tax=Seonamhaeicola maritimus TaxID=2591822 RepID=UPI0024947EF0|nr:ester cyclase [Seonamhaeicola maritimus]